MRTRSPIQGEGKIERVSAPVHVPVSFSPLCTEICDVHFFQLQQTFRSYLLSSTARKAPGTTNARFRESVLTILSLRAVLNGDGVRASIVELLGYWAM